jgi:hypothetical protein
MNAGKHGGPGNDAYYQAAERLDKLKQDLAVDLYRRNAGEVEARNVATRLNMTAAERRAKAPWLTQDVPDEQQIVRGRAPAIAQSVTPIWPGVQVGGDAAEMAAGAKRFISERLAPAENSMASIGSLHNAYSDWAGANGLSALSEGQFLLMLRNDGHMPAKLAGHTRFPVTLK